MSSTFNTYPCNTQISPGVQNSPCKCSMNAMPPCSVNRPCQHESTYVGCGS
jgi:hypothetical protein